MDNYTKLLHALRELTLSNSPSIDKSYVEEMLNNLLKEIRENDILRSKIRSSDYEK